MTIGPYHPASEFAEFAEILRDHRLANEPIVRLAMQRVKENSSSASRGDLDEASDALDTTFGDLDRAAEEICVQSEALFNARVEIESGAALFRELFELAPCAYIVTTPDTRIMYANDAACSLLQRRKNALAGKPLIAYVPLADRGAFRSAVTRSTETTGVMDWPAKLQPTGASNPIACRIRIRSVSGSGAQVARALYWNITEETDEDLF